MSGDSKVIGPARPLWTAEEAAHVMAQAAELPFQRVLAEDLTEAEWARLLDVGIPAMKALVDERMATAFRGENR